MWNILKVLLVKFVRNSLSSKFATVSESNAESNADPYNS